MRPVQSLPRRRPTGRATARHRAGACYTGNTGVVEYRPEFQVWRVQQPGASGPVFNPACGSAALRCTISTPVYPSSYARAIVMMRVQQPVHRIRPTPLTREAQNSEAAVVKSPSFGYSTPL